MTIPTLRPYQTEAADAIAKAVQGGLTRLLLQSATGTGKTTLFASLLQHDWIKAWLTMNRASKGAVMLVIAHREELLEQAAARIMLMNPGVMADIEQGDRYASRYSDVVVASIQTLSAMKYRRLQRFLQQHAPRIVVVDEAHHAAAATYRTALAHLGFLPKADISDKQETEAVDYDDVEVMKQALDGWDIVAPKDRLLLGVTATPNRSDAIGLACVFQSLVYSYPIRRAIEDGWLTSIVPWTIETAESLDAVRTSHGDFNQKDLAETVNTPRRNILAVEAWQLHASERSTIAFTVDVKHAHDMAAVFTAKGISAKALSGETPKDERRQILASFLDGSLQVVVNCQVLTEGVDVPRASCILMAKPTKSATLFEQCVGRGLRPFPGKTDCIVLDLVDVSRKHSLQVAPILFGLPPGVKSAGKDLRQVADDLEALREQYPTVDLDTILAQGRFTVEELRDRASTFDIWTVPTLGAFGHGRALNWIKSGAEEYRLQYPWADGTETLQVKINMLGKWEVVATLRPTGGGSVRQRTLVTEIETADGAAGLAEAFVLQERRSVTKLKDRDAPWRQRPASPKQIAYLQKLKIPFKAKGLTMGQCSDMIDIHKARKGR